MHRYMGPTAARPAPELRLAGLRFNPLGVEETVARLAGRDPAEPFAAYVTPNLEFIYWARRNPEFRQLLLQSWLSTNDSRALRRLGRWAGLELEFAPGAYVVRRLFQSVIQPDDPLTLLGGRPEMVAALAERGFRNIAHHNPPMGFIRDPAAVRAAADFVLDHPARFVFVNMGPPQSELLCQAVIRRGGATGLGLCVGSSLQVLTGQISPAPDWMESSGLVWLHRILREPRRLWRRYLVHDLQALGVALADVARLRAAPRSRHAGD